MSEINKRAQIKQEAARLFRKKGFRSTSMQDIADALDIKAASLYNHIASKQEILMELSLEVARNFTSGMTEIESSSLSPIDKLEELIKLHVDMTLKHKDSISLITGEWVHLEQPQLKDFIGLRNSYEDSFKNILLQCQNENKIAADINIDLALYSILSSLHWLYNWHNKHPEISRIELSKQLKDILLNGLIVK